MRTLFVSLFALAILFVPCVLPGQTRCAESQAEDLVRAELSRRGIRLNYDCSRHSVVAVGVASCGFDIKAGGGSLTTVRRRLVQEATLRAKAKLLSFVVKCMEGREGVLDKSGSADAEWRSFAEVSSWSRQELEGCLVVDSAEVFEEGHLAVAVAVEWSESLERDVRDISAGRVEITVDDRRQALALLGQKRLPVFVGTRFLRLKDGFNYPVGVGVVDVEGVKGFVLSGRLKEAELAAAQAYEGAFRATLLTRRKGNASVQQGQEHDGKQWMRVADQYVCFGETSSSDAHLIPREVLFEGRDVDPVTHRNVYVIVYGPCRKLISRGGDVAQPPMQSGDADF